MAAGLFAQIGLLAHLFSLLVPAPGAQAAGLATGLATTCAMNGRMVVASVLPTDANYRIVAALAYGVQLSGSMMLLLTSEQHIAWVLLSVALFGSGIGNATSLPPVIALAKFAKEYVPRVVALIVALGQAASVFAPAAFGLMVSASTHDEFHVAARRPAAYIGMHCLHAPCDVTGRAASCST
ncbi:MFS transporter [Hydrogenophaga sp. IBVHS1]|jgi:cyanate permease|uniref:MFS transporter n=1 Tax=unclassified Hydrogenophaga TaxID=2610897 RepID=UPI00117BB573|nr:MFS transporter [Hydrogenophaga sp. IBVHS1]